MRTSIENYGYADPRIFAMCIFERTEEQKMQIQDGTLKDIAQKAEKTGRTACMGMDCKLRAIAQRTGDGTLHEIDISCDTKDNEPCMNNTGAVLAAFDVVVDESKKRGVKEQPIDDWDNLQSRPGIEATVYLEYPGEK